MLEVKQNIFIDREERTSRKEGGTYYSGIKQFIIDDENLSAKNSLRDPIHGILI